MANVVVTITTVAQVFPVGTLGGLFRYTITDSAGVVVTQDSAELFSTFADVVPGDYIASAQRLDTAGAFLGSAISTKFTVPAPTVPVDVPATITVALS